MQTSKGIAGQLVSAYALGTVLVTIAVSGEDADVANSPPTGRVMLLGGDPGASQSRSTLTVTPSDWSAMAAMESSKRPIRMMPA